MEKFIPIELPRNIKSKSNYYEFYSVKNRRNVHIYSQYLYFQCLLFEMSSNIESYCEYPCEILIQLDGKTYNKIFDLALSYKSGQIEMLRIVSINNINNEVLMPYRLQDFCRKEDLWCKEHDYKYVIIQEDKYYHNSYYFHNIRFLYGLIKRNSIPLNIKYLDYVIRSLSNHKRKTILMLSEEINISISDLLTTIALGYYNGLLNFSNILEVINYNTEVELRLYESSI